MKKFYYQVYDTITVHYGDYEILPIVTFNLLADAQMYCEGTNFRIRILNKSNNINNLIMPFKKALLIIKHILEDPNLYDKRTPVLRIINIVLGGDN